MITPLDNGILRSVVAIGFLLASCVKGFAQLETFQRILGCSTPLTKGEGADTTLGATVVLTFSISIAWLFLTGLFYRKDTPKSRDRIEGFFVRLATPVVEEPVDLRQDDAVYPLLGTVFTVYGGFILALLLVPNPLLGRLCFAFCGGVLLTAGLVLSSVGRTRAEAPGRATAS